MALEPAQDAAFYRLPLEVLDLIADACWTETSYGEEHPKHLLRRLRTISRGFTQLPSINKRLFSTITLIASPGELARLKNDSLPFLARYVDKVIFRPSTYSWLLGPKRFSDILKVQALHQNVEDHFEFGMGSQRHGLSWYTDDHFPNYPHRHPFEEDPPFTATQIDQAYSYYRSEALDARYLVCGTALQIAWADALAHFPRVTRFKLALHDFDSSDSLEGPEAFSEPERPCAVQPRHPHDPVHTHWHCMQTWGPMGDLIWSHSYAAMQKAGSRVRTLVLRSAMSPTVVASVRPGEDDFNRPNIGDFDYKGLTQLKYRPKIMGYHNRPPEWEEHPESFFHWDFNRRAYSHGSCTSATRRW